MGMVKGLRDDETLAFRQICYPRSAGAGGAIQVEVIHGHGVSVAVPAGFIQRFLVIRLHGPSVF